MPKGGQPNNNNARIGNVNRVQWHGTVAQETLDAIRRLAHETGKSQSEVVDMWREASELLDQAYTALWVIWRKGGHNDDTIKPILQKIEQWKEQSQ